jgi:hypothetical protein
MYLTPKINKDYNIIIIIISFNGKPSREIITMKETHTLHYMYLTTDFLTHLTYERAAGYVGEERSEREGQGDVGKVDEYERSQTLEAECIKNVTTIERVAAKGVFNKTSEWPGGGGTPDGVCTCV